MNIKIVIFCCFCVLCLTGCGKSNTQKTNQEFEITSQKIFDLDHWMTLRKVTIENHEYLFVTQRGGSFGTTLTHSASCCHCEKNQKENLK